MLIFLTFLSVMFQLWMCKSMRTLWLKSCPMLSADLMEEVLSQAEVFPIPKENMIQLQICSAVFMYLKVVTFFRSSVSSGIFRLFFSFLVVPLIIQNFTTLKTKYDKNYLRFCLTVSHWESLGFSKSNWFLSVRGSSTFIPTHMT